MENLLLSPVEQQLVLKSKNFLERKYNVNISLPENVSPCERDVVVATIRGVKINLVKNFIQRRMVQMKQKQEQRITVQNNVTTITLSDSDSDSSLPVLMETQQKGKSKQNKKRKMRGSANKKTNESVDLSSTVLVEDSEESANEDPVPKKSKDESPPQIDFIPLKAEKENTVNFNEINSAINSTKVKAELPIPSANFIFLDDSQINGNTSKHNALNDTIILSDSPPPPDFISLKSKKKKKEPPSGIDDSDIIIEDEIPRPVVNEPRCLRPIVIDGSNVAREHGKVSNTYSCKGIKIAIDYFMERGHTQVTAFVPHYRRHNKFGPVFTTDQPLLEELAKGQHVVFTPSRRIDNKRVTCYDDRFIVELATKTGGVILSNDNYRDLAAESEEFKKTICERLLMFCFVGDIMMVPQDPLGRNGPSLANFLSFST